MTQEQELALMKEALRAAGGDLPEPETPADIRMEDIQPEMSDEDRGRTLKQILRVLRGEE